jgi:hypothetical protein
MGMLIINPKLTEEGLLSHIKNIDTYWLHLDYKSYS